MRAIVRTLVVVGLVSVFSAGCNPFAFKHTGVILQTRYLAVTPPPNVGTSRTSPASWAMSGIVEKNPLQVSPGMGRVVLFREKEYLTSAMGLVFETGDGRREICIGEGGCFTWQQAPGHTNISFYRMTSIVNEARLDPVIWHRFEVREGEVVFLRVCFVVDESAASSLHLRGRFAELAAEEGRAMLAKKIKPITFAE